MRATRWIGIFQALALALLLQACAGVQTTVHTSSDREELISLYGTLRDARRNNDGAVEESARLELSALGERAAGRVQQAAETADKIFLYYIAVTATRLALNEDALLTYSAAGEALCRQDGNFAKEPAKCTLITTAPLFAAAEIVSRDIGRFDIDGNNDPDELREALRAIGMVMDRVLAQREEIAQHAFLSATFKDTYALRAGEVYCWVALATDKYAQTVGITSQPAAEARARRDGFKAQLGQWAEGC